MIKEIELYVIHVCAEEIGTVGLCLYTVYIEAVIACSVVRTPLINNVEFVKLNNESRCSLFYSSLVGLAFF